VAGTPANKQVYDYVYRVDVRNDSTIPANVAGTVASKLGSLTVIDAAANFAVVMPGQTKSSVDTITIRAKKHFDRRLDPKELRDGRWQFLESGRDNDDDHVPGLAKKVDDWRDDVANQFYDLKFRHFFKWAMVIRPDITAPTISDMLPQGNQKTATPTVSAAYADGEDSSGIDLTKVTLHVDGVDVTAQVSKTAAGMTYQPPAAMAQGTHTVLLSIADKSGNPASATWTFTVDTIAPAILSQAPNNTISASPNVVIAAEYADTDGTGVDISRVQMAVDGADVTEAAVKTVSGIAYTSPTKLADGNHVVVLTVQDMAGNSTSATWTFGVDGIAPAISNLAPANNAILAAGMAQTIGAQFQDSGAGVDLRIIGLEVDGQNVTAQAQVTATGISYTSTQAFAQGGHTVKLTVIDVVGNTAVQTWTFNVDTIAPTISAQAPDNTTSASPAAAITAQYVDNDGSGIDTSKITLVVDGADVTGAATITATGISYTPAAALSDGNHTVALTVRDLAGNPMTANWSFGVDGTGPAVTNVTPTAGVTMAADAIPTISAQFQDSGTGVDSGKTVLEVDGQNVTALAQATATGIAYTPPQALTEGNHVVKLTVVDNAGNATIQTWEFKTATAPIISEQTPKDTFVSGGATPAISATYSDVGSGIDPTQIKLFFNGVDVTAQAVVSASNVIYTVPQALADATHQVKLIVADKAGNSTTSDWQFGSAQPPEIIATDPKDVMLPVGSRPTITASYQDSRVGIDLASVRLMVNSDDVTSLAQVTATGISYTPAQPLASGPYTVYLEVANTTNAAASAVWGFEVDEQKIYNVTITSPAGPQTVTSHKLEVVANAQANKTYPTRLVVNGKEMIVTGTADDGRVIYTGTVDLIDGINTITVQATFDDGEVRSTSTQVTYDAPPKVSITSPADKAMLGRANTSSPGNLTGNVERPVTITGRISKAVQSVTINQQQATLSNGNTEFRFENFFLREGMNMLTAVATDASGRVGSAAIQVSVDQTAPILTIEAPLTNAITSNSRIDVRGMVNDAVEAFIGAPEPQVAVTINGVTKAGQVADRFYLVADVPLQIGENTLTVTATDQFGNARSQDLKVSRIAVGSDRLTLLSGNNQSAKGYTELPKPLVVVALSAAGEPLANLPIRFDVLRGTGSISTTQGQATKPDGVVPARNLVITSDASGRAQVWLTTGKQSGPGANVVKANHPGLTEDVTFTATTERGAVFKINADLGTNQFAETGSQPLELLSVVVRDRDDNLLPNVPVVFTIEEGNAYFTDNLGGVAQNGGKRIVLNTDKNGMAALRPTIGNDASTVRIVAKALKEATGNIENASDLTGNATFYIQAKQAKDGPASFKGTIYTDKGLPLPGVRVSIGRTALAGTTDDQGRFDLANVPPGRIDLFIDGRTVNPTNDPSRQQWPSLHFEAYAVQGQDNVLAHPIYLPPLLTSEAKIVGGNDDVILKMPGVEGFQMKVKANSVTFPDGSRVGTLVVSPVTADRLPMAPPAGGAAFGIPAWTIQPAGTRFDPPIEVQMPNARANPAGDNIPIVQWDHDLGQYVPMGRATVSEDGAFLLTDAGSGITKAGWGGACVYDPDKCAKDAPKCKYCEEIDNSGDCPTCKFKFDPNKDQPKGQPVIFGFDASKTGIGEFITGVLKKLPVHSAFTKQKFKVDGVYSPREKCCESLGDVAEYKKIEVGPAVEISTPDIPIPGYSLYIPGAIEVGLFTKIKAQATGTIRFDYSPKCSPLFSNGSGQVTMSVAVEGTLKLETLGAKLNAITVGGGGGVACPVALGFLPCKGKGFVYAKSEFEVFNLKIGLIDFYASTDAHGNLPMLGFVD